jgi:hypothetical protein
LKCFKQPVTKKENKVKCDDQFKAYPKNSGLGQGELGLMQVAKRRFRGVGCAIRLDLSFWVTKIVAKMSKSQMCLT